MKQPEVYLNSADVYARMESGCCKVSVGSLIIDRNTENVLALGANRTMPVSCKAVGCLRIEKYGDDAKNHRNCGDCRAIHSEVDAISQLWKGLYFAHKESPTLSIYVTRYPCEECAKVIVASGISEVYYGREQEITEEAKKIFESGNVAVFWVKGWTREDTTR